MKLVEGGVPIKFLSTLSARRATWSGAWRRPSHRHFYPHPPRGGRPHISREEVRPFRISIHALREEGDGIDLGIKDKDLQFLSTPSARRATLCRWAADHRWRISIHALREEGDATARDTTCRRMNFYPRPPRGGRQSSPYIWMMVLTFLSTPSARRATTPWQAMPPAAPYFYPRPPRGGRLSASRSISSSSLYFYPRPPRGGRQTEQLKP